MNRMTAWSKTEIKRMCKKLPVCLTAIAIFVIVTGMAVFGVYEFFLKENRYELVVGYVAEDEMTRMAASYFEELSSVSDWCRFQKITETAGKKALEEGTMQALIVLPQGMVESILTGENKTPTLYLSQEISACSTLVESLGNAGISMLQTAQMQIYAAYDLGASHLSEEINRENLEMLTDRERLFYRQTLGITDRHGIVNYYISAGMTLFLLCMPVFFGFMLERETAQVQLFKKRLGISVFWQALIQVIVVSGVIFVGLTLWGGASLTTWLISCSVGAYVAFLNAVFGKKRYVAVFSTLLTILIGYVTGCFLPEVLLKDNIQTFAGFLPCYAWRNGLLSLLCKEELAKKHQISCLLWTVIFLFGQIAAMEWRMARPGKAKEKKVRKECFYHRPVWAVLLHRLCMDGRFWVCMLLPILLFHGVCLLEETGETTITVGICDKEGIWEDVFTEENGISYRFYQEETLMQEAVKKGTIHCGVTFPENLSEKLLKKEDMTWCIPVYEREDAILTGAIEECVYAGIFTEISNRRYIGFLADRISKKELSHVFETVKEKTFRLEKKMIFSQAVQEHEKERERNGSLLKKGMQATMYVLAFGYGISQVCYDRKRLFYHRLPGVIRSADILFPLILCFLIQFLLT